MFYLTAIAVSYVIGVLYSGKWALVRASWN